MGRRTKSEWNNKTSPWTVRKCVLKHTELMNENEVREKEIRFRGRARTRNWNRMQNKSTCHTNIEQAVLVALGNAPCVEGDLLQWQFWYMAFTSFEGNHSGRFVLKLSIATWGTQLDENGQKMSLKLWGTSGYQGHGHDCYWYLLRKWAIVFKKTTLT